MRSLSSSTTSRRMESVRRFDQSIFVLFFVFGFDNLTGLRVDICANDPSVATQQADLVYESIAPATKFRAERFGLQARRCFLHGAERFGKVIGDDLFACLPRRKTSAPLQRLRQSGDAKTNAGQLNKGRDQNAHATLLRQRR
ncbi:protein of unknown function [Methylocella tundrae]|uniref:Uncharacterized protein n=1 Tax=Methylocella tundrae TaxID=227605 RepID=A0A4V6IMB3_METTU|nr:protein of unknown function [Methylocella tundrae]